MDVEWQLASKLPSLRPARSPLDLRQRCWKTVLVTPKLLVRLSVLVLQTLHNTDASKDRESDSKHPCWLVSLLNQRVWRLSIKSTHLLCKTGRTQYNSHSFDVPRKAIIARRPCLISAVFKRKALESPSLAKPRGSKAPPANVQYNVSHQLCSLHATDQQNKLQSSGTCDSEQSHNRPCLKGLQRQHRGGGGGGGEDDSMTQNTSQIREPKIQSFNPQLPSATMSTACQTIMKTTLLGFIIHKMGGSRQQAHLGIDGSRGHVLCYGRPQHHRQG